MSWVDLLILGIIAISVIVSFFRGFLREALSLLVWIAAFWVAWLFFRDVEGLFAEWISAPSVRMAVAYAAIVIVVLILGGLLTWLIGTLADKTGLSGTDRIIGIFFGGARGVALVAIAVMLAGVTPFPQDSWWQESQLIPHFEEIAEWGKAYLPKDVADYIQFDEAVPQQAPVEKAEEGI